MFLSVVLASEVFRAALLQMRMMPEPPVVTYRVRVDRGDASVALSRNEIGYVRPIFQFGQWSYPATSWSAVYRASDGNAIVTFAGGKGVSTLAFFDPTWSGLSLWLHRGSTGTLFRPINEATPTPAASGTPEPNIIATVYSIDASDYRARDAGISWCGTDPGRLIGLTAVSDPERHPLQRLVVDAVDGHVCTVRFRMAGDADDAHYEGYVELQLAMKGPYDLVQSGYLDLAMSQRGARVGWAHVRYHYLDLATPLEIPADTFSAP